MVPYLTVRFDPRLRLFVGIDSGWLRIVLQTAWFEHGTTKVWCISIYSRVTFTASMCKMGVWLVWFRSIYHSRSNALATFFKHRLTVPCCLLIIHQAWAGNAMHAKRQRGCCLLRWVNMTPYRAPTPVKIQVKQRLQSVSIQLPCYCRLKK